jgi:NodT family efflux transporter outer membrane factor (OMF) lipoprotein
MGHLQWRRVAIMVLALVLSACASLGPSYEEPSVDWLEQWQPGFHGLSRGAQGRQQLDRVFWWRTFNDPALNRLIDIARRENPSLRTAGLRVMESRALLGVAGSSLYPQVQQVNGQLGLSQLQRQGGGQPDISEDFVSRSAGFKLGWELDFWGKFRRSIESADAAFFASVANQQAMQVLISAQVADIYYSYRATRLRLAIARRNARIQKRSYEITERIYQRGGDSELDLQQAKTQYLATQATIPKFEQGLVQTRNALNALLGRPPGPIAELGQSPTRLPRVGPRFIRDVPARLLARRPDVRAALWQVAALSAQIGIAEADLYPSISLFGSINWSGNSLSFTPDERLLALGPSFNWNIFDHGRIRNNVRVQDARLQQAISQYREILLQAAREIDDAAIAVVKTVEQERLLKQSVAAGKRALDIANTRYREGYADFQRVLDAQRAYFAQADSQVVSQSSHISAVIALYKGLAGGWLPDTTAPLLSADDRAAMQARTDWGKLLDAPVPNQPLKPSSEAAQHE